MRSKKHCPNCRQYVTAGGPFSMHVRSCYEPLVRERLRKFYSLRYHSVAIEKALMDRRNTWDILQSMLEVSEEEIWAWLKANNYLHPNEEFYTFPPL